jgi:hypothetical protein
MNNNKFILNRQLIKNIFDELKDQERFIELSNDIVFDKNLAENFLKEPLKVLMEYQVKLNDITIKKINAEVLNDYFSEVH